MSKYLSATAGGVTDGTILSHLGAGTSILDPIVVIVAHPDDEVLSIGGRLSCLKNLTLIHATSGASDDPAVARAHGFRTPEHYSAARFRELRVALQLVGARRCNQVRLGFADGTVALHLDELANLLVPHLRVCAAVITHPYEGGHPDHDACAFAVQAACGILDRAGMPCPQRLEFAGYHSRGEKLSYGDFWPDESRPATAAALSPRQRLRKFIAMKTFRSQPWFRSTFRVRDEAYRRSPHYDFRDPHHLPPGAWLYDANGWQITGSKWLMQAGAALDRLEGRNSTAIENGSER